MKLQELKEYILTGREIEFTYNGKDYSITYYNDDREKYISFCEFNKVPLDVSNVEELLEIKQDGITVKEIIESLTNEDYSIY